MKTVGFFPKSSKTGVSKLSEKAQIVNILGFAGHTVSAIVKRKQA